MCNTIRSSNRARQRVAGGVVLECGVQSCITTATVLQYRQWQRAFFFFFLLESICVIQAASSEMFSSLVKNPAPTPPPLSPLMAPNKERKSRSACLGAESSFLFFPSQLAELADGCLHNDRRRVGRWNWFTAPVHTPFTVHFPSPHHPLQKM